MYLFNFYSEQLVMRFFFFIYCFSLGKHNIYHDFISNQTLGNISGRLLGLLCTVKKSLLPFKP